MKFLVLYNAEVELDDGDLVALTKRGELWVRNGNDLYKAVQRIAEGSAIPRQLTISSAGDFARHSRDLPEGLEWMAYSVQKSA